LLAKKETMSDNDDGGGIAKKETSGEVPGEWWGDDDWGELADLDDFREMADLDYWDKMADLEDFSEMASSSKDTVPPWRR
jgi:hypothetical protein